MNLDSADTTAKPGAMRTFRLGILSDVHYASAAEQARGNDYEYRGLPNPLVRLLVKLHRRHLWLRNPLDKNYLLDRFLAQSGELDFLVAVGDFSCNSAFVGVSDDAAFASARECLGKLRGKFGERFRACIGDHELGKFSLAGRRGGMRLSSWRRVRDDLGLEPFWFHQVGNHTLMGVTSSLLILPVLQSEILPEERDDWNALRAAHLREIRAAFTELPPGNRVLLFCHDPTALAFLGQEEVVLARLPQIENTVIGHLHSNLIWRMSQVLAGMPVIPFLGHSAKRLTAALHEARQWKPFNVRLCPSLAGTELLKDGGFYTALLDPAALTPPRYVFHSVPR